MVVLWVHQGGRGVFLPMKWKMSNKYARRKRDESKILEMQMDWDWGQEMPHAIANPDGVQTLCVPNSTTQLNTRAAATMAPAASSAAPAGAGSAAPISGLAASGDSTRFQERRLDCRWWGVEMDSYSMSTVTPWIPPYNLPKDEYCMWRVKLSVEGGHSRAHYLENPWLWCGCSKKGIGNRGTFLEASDSQRAHDVKVACQGDDVGDGLLPRQQKCVWTGEGSDRMLP